MTESSSYNLSDLQAEKEDKLRLEIFISQSKWSSLIYNTKEKDEKI